MKLSIALCTYNGSPHLVEQLNSLAAQTRLPDELVVCDDLSTDDTVTILNRFASSAFFPVRVFVNDVNLGSTKNFERAISLCTGDIIFLCDQDDVWQPNKLARVAAAFAADKDIGLVASDAEVLNPTGDPVGRRLWADLPFTQAMLRAVEAGAGPQHWLRYNTITGATAAFRADLRSVILPIPACWVHDGWIAFLTAAVARVRLIPEPLIGYRTHTNQQIGSAPLTLARQLQTARRMNAAYFCQVAACFAAAADRLATLASRVRDTELLALTRGKAAYARVQQRMREGSRAERLLPAVRELIRGNYHRFGRGLKGFAADLLL